MSRPDVAGSAVIDLTRSLPADGGPHPSYRSQILRQQLHADFPAEERSWATEVLITSTHAGTHVDAFGHYDPEPGAPNVGELSLGLFYGPALCVDVRSAVEETYLSAGQLQAAVDSSGEALHPGDILLLCSDHQGRHPSGLEWRSHYAGVSPEAVHWMADRGVKIFGVETPSPDLPHLRRDYPAHRACAERRLTHYENLDNLVAVVNTRFVFSGFPLKLELGNAAPVRAVAIARTGSA